jgi:hypothetical protein
MRHSCEFRPRMAPGGSALSDLAHLVGRRREIQRRIDWELGSPGNKCGVPIALPPQAAQLREAISHLLAWRDCRDETGVGQHMIWASAP